MTDNVIKLDCICDAHAAVTLHKVLLEKLHMRTGVTIEGDVVERVSTPVVQVLLSANKSFGMAGIDFHLTHFSQKLDQAFTDLGLNPIASHFGACIHE
jgi:anti-anti-sigma regulatory factor